MKKPSITDLKPFPLAIKNLEDELRLRGSNPELPLKKMKDLSNKLWGFHKKKMCVIGARTSNGKSALTINIAYDLALQGKKVLFLSLEMPVERIVERMFCLEYSVDNYALLKNAYNNNESIRQKFEEFKSSNLKSNLVISDCIGKDWKFVENLFKSIEQKPDVIILDHIQEIRGTSSQKSAIDEHVSVMRESAIRNNFALIVCSQVNRVSQADKEDKEPQLHHLKSSGFLEEAADQVILLHWSWHYDNSKNKNELILNVAKNRDGMTGRIKMFFRPEYCQISDLPKLPHSEYYEKLKILSAKEVEWKK